MPDPTAPARAPETPPDAVGLHVETTERKAGAPGDLSQELHCRQLTEAEEVRAARALVARVYVQEGYLEPSDLLDDGVPREDVDPYYSHSVYFGVSHSPTMDPLIAVSRIVLHHEDKGRDSFPMLAGMTLDDEFEQTTAAADLRSWAEVGAMAKVPGTTVQAPNLLYRHMWHWAVRDGHATWLFAADQRVSRTLQNLFGEEVTLVGPRQHFMGSPTDPMVMHPPTSADWIAKEAAASWDDDSMVAQLVRLALAFFLEGLEPTYFTDEQLDRFAAGGVDLRASVVVDLSEGEPIIDLRDKG